MRIATIGIWVIFGLIFFASALGIHVPLPQPPVWVAGYSSLALAIGLLMERRE
jgi:uncharacterized membrane protein